MDALRKSYESLGFRNINTYLQSGNVVFACNGEDPVELARAIRERVAGDAGIDVPVLVLPVGKLARIIDGNPFASDAGKDKAFLHVTFLAGQPAKFDSEAFEGRMMEGEAFVVAGDAVYLYLPHGYGSTKLNNGFLEARLKVTATTRNWKTTNELLRLAKSPE
jgi:uncharacterized protein (DUF1697 family)